MVIISLVLGFFLGILFSVGIFLFARQDRFDCLISDLRRTRKVIQNHK